MDPFLPRLVGAVAAILLITLGMRRLRQPHVVAYLAAGIALGPYGLGLFADQNAVARVGEVGVILLLFFVGMEVSVPRLLAGWRVAIVGTFLQILSTTLCVFALGAWFDWPFTRTLLFGFALSLSSTAIVVSMLRSWREIDSDTGQDALGVLLVQDVAIVPMLIVISFLGGDAPSRTQLISQLVGGAAIVALLILVGRRGSISLPFRRALSHDRELQVFAAFLTCFGFAFLTASLGLSTALGAFVAGVFVAAARETESVRRSLESFRVMLVALFFVSIGMLIDISYLARYWLPVSLLVLVVIVTNTLINALILRSLGRSWIASWYVAALLAQIGEFSFVLAAVGRQQGIITDFTYTGIVSVIAVTLAVSPLWIALMRRSYVRRAPEAAEARM
jgi:CPA2 family monovalent cation:H+ antiporter-2